MTIDISALRAKLASATKRPWRVSMSGYSIKSDDPDVPIVAAPQGGAQCTKRQLEAWIENAPLIAAAVNEAEKLCDEVERLRNLVERAAAILEANSDKGARREWAAVLREDLAGIARERSGPPLTEAQRVFLEYAASAPSRGWDGVHPRRGQHQMVARLVSLGLLAPIGDGVDADDHMREVDLFAITDAGRAALANTGGV